MATICDSSTGRFHFARLDLSPLGLAGSLGGIFSILSKKSHEIYRKRAPIPAKFEVEHDF